MLSKKDIVKYYIAMFNRIPEKEAIETWYNEANQNNWNETELVSALLNAAVNVVNSNDDFKSLYPQYVNYNENDINSVKKVIESVYESLFDKSYEDDPEGIDSWAKAIVEKKMSLPDAIVTIEHFTEDVYNNKIDLNTSYSPQEIEKIKEAAQTFETRVDFANVVSSVIEDIKITPQSLQLLQEDIQLVHTEDDEFYAYQFLIANLNDISNSAEEVKNNLEHIINHQDSVTNEENLSFIDLPSHFEESIEDSYLI